MRALLDKAREARGSRQAARASRKAAQLSRKAATAAAVRRRRRGPGAMALIAGGIAGGLIAYFLDPDRGKGRRVQAGDRLSGLLHRSSRRLDRLSRGVNAQATGLTHRVVHLRSGRPAGDDVTIADRVESQVFRATGVPRGGVVIDVRGGIVVLRGELERQDQIDAIERATRRVYGVAGVHNLLHLPGTPAPTAPERGEQSGS